MENFQQNFQGTVALCKEYLMAKTKVELEQYNQHCQECYEEKNLRPLPLLSQEFSEADKIIA